MVHDFMLSHYDGSDKVNLMMLTLITWVKLVSARFLHCKGTLFLIFFVINKYLWENTMRIGKYLILHQFNFASIYAYWLN